MGQILDSESPTDLCSMTVYQILMSLSLICVLMLPTIFFSHKQMWEPYQMNMEIKDEGAKLIVMLCS